ncbi:tetratricopeptide repeat protein [Ralstonia pseudosolanacearum]|uniref:tetratricopeptide repeat protein n=1 Tax=Ralstonia pseudosolanacearum TaxID=1310165 RepID=UPI0018D02A3B|nr:tetratricopeptide repeat protein [Ralstonia pseudosolanacearum]UWD92085.1 tetratricopeptide repeat protein [Ralstonia pseudosolanacearum]
MSESKIDLSPFCMRARGFLTQGRTDDALALYGDVLQVDPDNALAHADRGTAYAMLKKFDPALRDLERALALGYSEASTYCTIGTVYVELKKFQKALEYFTKAIALDENYPFTYYSRSNVLHELGATEAAIADLERCLGFNPEESMRKLTFRRLNFFIYKSY